MERAGVRRAVATVSMMLAIVAAIVTAPQAHADELAAGQEAGALSPYALLKSDGYLVPCSSSGVEISDTWQGSAGEAVLDRVGTVYIAPDIQRVTDRYWVKYSAYHYNNERAHYFSSNKSTDYYAGLPGLSKVVFLPGSKCTAIGQNAFENSNLGSISLPDGVGSIGDSAFRGCTSLYEINVGSSLRSIGKGSFFDCSSLTEIDLPATLSTINSTNDNWAGSAGWEPGSGSFCRSGLTKVTLRSISLISDGSDGKYVWRAFKNTPITQAGDACIYVPTSMLTTYRTHRGIDGADGDGWSYFNQSHLDKLRGIDGEPTSIKGAAVALSQTSYTYNGGAKKPTVTVTLGGKTLVKDVDYSVSYANNVNAGTASAVATGIGMYTGNASAAFRIDPAEQPMKVTPKTLKAAKSAQAKTYARSKALAVSKAKGTVTYKKISGNNKITVNAKNGNVTVKGGLKKNTYSVKVRVKAANKAGSNYKTGYKDVTFKVKVG